MERQRRPGWRYPITAYGMCNSLGVTTAEVIASLAAGRASLSAPPLDLPFETVCGVLPADLPELPAAHSGVDSRISRIAALALQDVQPALSRAVARWGADRVGAVVGTTTGGLAQTEAAYAERVRTGKLSEWFDFERQHPFHVVVGVVCALAGIEGARFAVSTACSSSAKAFGSASRLLSSGVCDAVLVGGVDTLCQTTLRGFHALGVLSPVACRPFGRDRAGISIGEGGAFLLIERTGEGPARLLGVGEASDAHHVSSPDPSGRGARAAMREALAQAGLAASDVDYVNAHGTGTRLSDVVEASAIAEVFGNGVPVASTKGYSGHLLGACGATEAALVLASIERGFVPASLGARPLDPEVAIRVALDRIDAPVRVAVSNSFAFGGNNATLVFGAAD